MSLIEDIAAHGREMRGAWLLGNVPGGSMAITLARGEWPALMAELEAAGAGVVFGAGILSLGGVRVLPHPEDAREASCKQGGASEDGYSGVSGLARARAGR